MNNPVKDRIVKCFTDFESLFKQFFNQDGTYDEEGIEFKVQEYHENVCADIQNFWTLKMMPFYQDIKDPHSVNELEFFKTEFESFYKHVIYEYFGENYQSNFRVGRPIKDKEYNNLNDNAQEWYQQVAPFAAQKKALFELLRDYRAQIMNIESIQHGQPSKSNKNKPKISPTSFEEVFIGSDFHKYIDALRYTEPPLLNHNMEFIGKRRGGTGEVGLWIAYLKFKSIINPNISRQKLAVVFSNNIKNLHFGKDARTIGFDSTVAHTPTLEQLIKRTMSPVLAKD